MPKPYLSRVEFSEEDDLRIVQFLAKYTPDGRDRSGNAIWLSLRNNPRKWPWCERHSWQSWRNRYCKDRDRFDVLVRKWLKRYHVEPGILPPATPHATPSVRTRVQFSAQDDNFLEQYLAKYSISSQGRLGNKLYTTLVANEKQKWPWAKRHPASAWRERYKNNRELFDELIADRQKDNPPVENFQTPVRVPRKRVRRRVQEEEEEADGQEERAAAERPRTTEKVDERGHAANMVIQEDDEREEKEESEQESGPSDKKGKGTDKRKRSNGSATEIAMEPERKRRRVEGPADDAHEELTEPNPTPNGPVSRPQKEHEHAPGSLQRAEVLPANQQVAASAKATSWVDGGDRAEREAQLMNPPPSDDYQGDVFAKQNEEDVEDVEEEEEEVDQLDSASPSPKRDSGEQKMNVDVDVDLLRLNGKDDGSEARQAHHLATPLPFGADVDHDLTPNGRLYPKVPSPPGPVGGDSSLPHGYPRPATSTPVRQGRLLNLSVVSQFLPSLLWSQKAPAKTAQRPTPPTSHTETPLETPTAATKRISVDTNGADKHAQSTIPDGNHEEATDMPAETTVPSAGMAAQPNSEAGPSTVIASAPRSHIPRPSLTAQESEYFQSDTPTPPSKPNTENNPMRMKRRRAPVQLEQGAFNSAFTDNKGRRRLDGAGRRPRVSGVEADVEEEEAEENDEELVDDIEWPPRRRKDKGKGKQRETGTFGALSEAVRPETDTRDVQPSASTSNAPATMHHPFSQFSQPEEASHVTEQFRPLQHHPFSQATQPVAGPSRLPPTFFIDEREAINVSKLSRIQIAKDPRIQAIVRKSTHLLQSDTANVGQGMNRDRLEPIPSTTGTVRTEDPVVRPVLVPFRLPELEKARTERRFSAGEAPKNSQADELRNIRPEQRQTVAKSNGKQPLTDSHHPGLGNRRHTMGPPVDVFEITVEEAVEVPHSDGMRISMKRDRRSMPSLLPERMAERNVDGFKVMNRSRQMRTRSSATNIPSNEPSDQLSEADESLMLSLAEKELRRLGMESAIQTMSDNHGFNPNVVRAVFDRTTSLRKTDNVLRRMREAADQIADVMIDDADSEEDVNASRRSRRSRPSFQGKEHEAPLRSSHVRNSSILQHGRMDFGDNDEEPATVYSPPKQSRAGQFTRLVREGREEEAFSREASGILGTTPLQTPAWDGDGPSNWQERSYLTTSPTHKAYRGHFSRSGSPILEERRHDQHLETPSQQSSANMQALTEALKLGKLGKLDELNEKVGSQGMQILFGAMFRRMFDDS